MPVSIYRQSITHAWQLTWKNKTLWILGLLSVFLGEFGLNNFAGQILQPNMPSIKYIMPLSQVPDAKTAIGLIWIMLILCGLGILIILAATIAEGALIFAAANWYKKNSVPSSDQLWKRGVISFWKVLTINIISKVLLAGLATGGWCIWIKITLLGGSLAGWLSVLLMSVEIFLALTVACITIFSLCYAVVGGNNLWHSIKRGSQLFKEHVLVSLELSIVLFVLNIFLLLVILVFAAFAFIPSLFIWLIAAVTGQTWLILVGLFTGWILLILFIAIAGAIFNTFSTSAWVYFFMKMHHEGILSRIIHHVKKIFRK